jgi:hypothetical protein
MVGSGGEGGRGRAQEAGCGHLRPHRPQGKLYMFSMKIRVKVRVKVRVEAR